MKTSLGTPLQALKHAHTLGDDAASFISLWMLGDVSVIAEAWPSYPTFCVENPDLPERADGRKAHYGEGEQPWDTALRLGWGPVGAAFCVIRYLRRSKDLEHSNDSAKVYFGWLRELAEMDMGVRDPRDGVVFGLAAYVFRQLLAELSVEERASLGVPACFRLKERSE